MEPKNQENDDKDRDEEMKEALENGTQHDGDHIDYIDDGVDIVDAKRIWKECEACTSSAASELAEKLRLILEPTEATRLTGDFKTGKRLNMRRVIGFIASDYRKDKIWLRRNRPDKRRYDVFLAIDNSKSMSESGSGRAAIEATALLTNAMARLDIGDVGTIRFGGNLKVLHEPRTPFSGTDLVSQLAFDTDNTISDSPMLELVHEMSRTLDSSKGIFNGRNKDVVMQQLVLILADGRLHENKDNLQKAVRNLSARSGVLVVFIILDGAVSSSTSRGAHQDGATCRNAQSSKSQSIIDMQSVSFENGKPKFDRYLDSFPFPYYVIIKNMSDLPKTLGSLLKQWIEASVK